MLRLSAQYLVDLKVVEPTMTTSSYALYVLSVEDLKRVLREWDKVSWVKEAGDVRDPEDGEFHPTAIARPSAPAPIRDFLKKGEPRKSGRVLYHGVGRDESGTKALSMGGKRTVQIYDPYHEDEKVTKVPEGKFDEVHNHYTLNVVTKAEGKKILQEISKLLSGVLVVSVRRDRGSMSKAAGEVRLKVASEALR